MCIVDALSSVGAKRRVSGGECWLVHASIGAATKGSVDRASFDGTDLQIEWSSADAETITFKIAPSRGVPCRRKACYVIKVSRIE